MFYEVLMEKRAQREWEKRANLLNEMDKHLARGTKRVQDLKKAGVKPKRVKMSWNPFKTLADIRYKDMHGYR